MSEFERENKKMSFRVISNSAKARHGLLKLAHGHVDTPVFMPVGTQGIKLLFFY